MRRRHVDHDEEHENQERWLLSYADMITLLCALFIMLYALSVLDLRKFSAFQESFNKHLGKGVEAAKGPDDLPTGRLITKDPGALNGTKMPTAPPKPAELIAPAPKSKPIANRKDLAELKKKMEFDIKKAGLSGKVEIALDERGLVVFVASGVLFDSGEAALLPNGVQILDRLAPVFGRVGNDLIVEGHT